MREIDRGVEWLSEINEVTDFFLFGKAHTEKISSINLFQKLEFCGLGAVSWFSMWAMNMTAKATASLVPIAMPYLIMSSPNCVVGIGCVDWQCSPYYWQTTLIPSSCGMLVWSEHTSSETRIALSGSGVCSMKFMKWVVYLIYDSCFLAIGCKSESRKLEIRSVGPPLPETIGLPTGVGLCILVSV